MVAGLGKKFITKTATSVFYAEKMVVRVRKKR
jgi:hypothetical protein